MIDHITLQVSDYEEAKSFYNTVLGTLGYTLLSDYKEYNVLGYGKDKPVLWLSANPAKLGGETHVGFIANSKEEVHAFYEAAIKAGAKDNGPPGPRPDYGPTYYAAFVITKDGHNIEALIK